MRCTHLPSCLTSSVGLDVGLLSLYNIEMSAVVVISVLTLLAGLATVILDVSDVYKTAQLQCQSPAWKTLAVRGAVVLTALVYGTYLDLYPVYIWAGLELPVVAANCWIKYNEPKSKAAATDGFASSP